MHPYLVVVFDVKPVCGLTKALGLVEIPQIGPDVGVVHYPLLVALQVNTANICDTTA